MSTETVTLGCRLPQGFTLEVGLTTTEQTDRGLMPKIVRTSKYKRITLLGTNAGWRKTRLRMPSTLSPEPHLNAGIPKDFWEQWLKEHPRSWAVSQGHIFEVKNASPAENQAAVMDAMSKPLALAPLDPTKPMKVGNDKVETANFNE